MDNSWKKWKRNKKGAGKGWALPQCRISPPPLPKVFLCRLNFVQMAYIIDIERCLIAHCTNSWSTTVNHENTNCSDFNNPKFDGLRVNGLDIDGQLLWAVDIWIVKSWIMLNKKSNVEKKIYISLSAKNSRYPCQHFNI